MQTYFWLSLVSALSIFGGPEISLHKSANEL